jgi:hypothetical protein
MDVFLVEFVHYMLKNRQLAIRPLMICPRPFLTICNFGNEAELIVCDGARNSEFLGL